ncbi:MAG: glycerophosphodiester phosphodiesterase family protein [Pseudomonadota bacterium]
MAEAVPLDAAFLRHPLAHRGLHDRDAGIIENSLTAVLAAAEAGYGVEIDLQLSSDGEAMVFHDDALARLTGRSGPVGALTAAELQATPLLGAADPAEGPPRFADLLEALDGRAPLLVEIKSQPTEAATRALTRRACAILSGREGAVAVMSFDPTAVLAAAEVAPEIPRGLVSMDYEAAAARGDGDVSGLPKAVRTALTEMAAWQAAGCAFASFRWQDLPSARTEALRAAGAPVLCWTTRSAEDDAAARRQADNVTFEGYRPPLRTAAPH